MDQTRATSDRGFTLVEIVIAVAIVATTVAAGVGISLASRSFAVSAAATEFDHLLDSARTIARETAGATLVFAPDAYGDGTEVRVLAPGPNATLVATTMPILHTHAAIEETQSLGKAPFAFVVHASGALGGRPGYRLGNTTASGEVGCPASGSFHFVIHNAGTAAERYIPCRITLAANGPVALTAWPPASVAPAPTPCSGNCAPAALPTAPSSTPSCPPNYAATSSGCTPTPPASSGPHYHVTATVASPTMLVGGTDSVTAQAVLTNPTAVAPGTPATVPVMIQVQTGTVCTATPPGPQPSNSVFTLNASSSGVCGVTVKADTVAIPGASADGAVLAVAISTASSLSPPPVTCDLLMAGKCFHRIVNRTSQQFYKIVYPVIKCDQNACHYVDAIQEIELRFAYGVQTPIPPVDADHELLFRIDGILGVWKMCEPYSFIKDVPAGTMSWPETGIGAPVDAPSGFGQPDRFFAVNHLMFEAGSTGGLGLLDVTNNGWTNGTTLSELYAAVALQSIGSAYTFTFSSPSISDGALILWYPDFPACDASGDVNSSAPQFGIATATLLFEVFQASP